MSLSCQRASGYLRFSTFRIYTHTGLMKHALETEEPVIQWQKQLPVAQKPEMECILDKRVGRKTRRKQYFEYLVKWKNHPVEDASWETEAVIQKHGQTVQELMDRSP
jgi:hypothetical protein